MSEDVPKTAGETEAHRDLKRRALLWAQASGFRIAAAEVSLPNYRVRMDVAACRPERVREARGGPGKQTARLKWRPTVGVTAIFECKAFRSDFVRDGRSITRTMERLKILEDRRGRAEEELKIHYPSIRNGDSLFQEYETLDFQRPGYERYEKIIREMRQLSARLHENTKFERLARYAAANLFYVVAEPGLVTPGTLPCGWGLLEREGDALVLKTKPIWHQVPEDDRLAFLHRVAMAATRAVNREHGAVLDVYGLRPSSTSKKSDIV
jgi:hypothetical protein